MNQIESALHNEYALHVHWNESISPNNNLKKKAIYDMEINGPHQHWKMPQVVWNFLNTVDSYFTPVCMSTWFYDSCFFASNCTWEYKIPCNGGFWSVSYISQQFLLFCNKLRKCKIPCNGRFWSVSYTSSRHSVVL